MTNQGKDILNCLNEIKGNGSFASSGAYAFVFPGMEVEGVGELSYPINELQARGLISVAHKAPFGKGSSTIVDNNVRRAWEIDAALLKFNGDTWAKFLDKLLSVIKHELGIVAHTISAHLYKMLVYEKGDFFLSHKDSEKEKGMFGTLIIGLPGRHAGGELLVKFDGTEKTINFDSLCSNNEIPYAAFYADCDHEIKPLTSGYRVVLVYNLIQEKAEKKIQLQSLEKHVAKLSEILKADESDGNAVPKFILLGHQYTPENFSEESLKLNDRSKAEALIRAAQNAGYYAKMCLVTSYLSGPPAGSGYYYSEPDEDAEMEEVYDQSLYIEYWLDDGVPPLRNIKFEEKDLLASFHLDDDEPIVKESTGYMGNYGPDLMHWYHYGAVMLWSKTAHEKLLLKQNPANKLEWLEYYNKNRSRLNKSEIALCETILSASQDDEKNNNSANYNIIADWLTGANDHSYLNRKGKSLLKAHFLEIDTSHWSTLAKTYPTDMLGEIFKEMAQSGSANVIAHLLSILNILSEQSACSGIVALQMKELPEYFSALASRRNKNKPMITAKTLRHILNLEKRFPQDEVWIRAISSMLTAQKERSYINNVLAREIISLNNTTDLAYALLLACHDDLQYRVNNKPKPPTDWSRQVPVVSHYANQWKLLEEFLQSPIQQVFEYRKNQQERDAIENAIRNVEIDLKTETIKKGSPHTLRITKTQAAYKRQMDEWNEDELLLKHVDQKKETFAGQLE